LAEYRLEELSRISGVSARNIRAYRERGLLDAPRRVGRSAFYDDYHLSQLRTINQLLRRGFNSAHIAEFFASMRQGVDLADILGIRRALLGPMPDDAPNSSSDADRQRPSDGEPVPKPRGIGIDPDSEAARQLIELGLAEVREDCVVVTDPSIAEILGRASDQLLYVRALLRIYESSRDAADGLVSSFVRILGDSVEARFGEAPRPAARELDELGQLARDHRQLWGHVLSIRMEDSLRRQLRTVGAGQPAGGLLSELLRRCTGTTPG
jgi:DNA-binding transcriptional MerR regulator